MKPTATLMRFSYQEKQTLGYLTFDNENDDRFFVLELPWKENKKKISCIPEGVYNMVQWHSPSLGKCMKICSVGKNEVEGRSAILQHRGNYHTDIEGCQLPGVGMADINKDGLHDVTGSGTALDRIMAIAPEGYTLIITSPFETE